jgi:hypothetical protein
MIRGSFVTHGARERPFVEGVFHFPALNNQTFDVSLLVDTGADRTILSSLDARRLSLRFQLDLRTLPQGAPSTGVGGRVATRTLDAVLTLDSFATAPFPLVMLEAPPGPLPAIPSLLGRDILSQFALFLEERTGRVLLSEPAEADALQFP